MIIDSHCHLDYPSLNNELDEVINRAYLNGVEYLLTISTTIESYKKIKEIVKKYKNVYGTLGIHPHETKNFSNFNIETIKKMKSESKKIIGIGETGLDFYYNHSDKKVQKKIFAEHINAAIELNLPVIVHTRNAESETLDIINSEKKNSNLNVLIHCFTGTEPFARNLLDIGCYISLSGIITFKNSLDLVNTVNTIPLDRLLVETDSPYLAPIPFRGKSNEPAYIKYVVEKLALIKKVSIEKVMKETTNNFFKIFNLNSDEN